MTWRTIDSAPKGGRKIRVRSKETGLDFLAYWGSEGTSWVDGDLQTTGCWFCVDDNGEDDGWLQPDEADAWAEPPQEQE